MRGEPLGFERKGPRSFWRGKFGTTQLWRLPLPHSLGSWEARCSSDTELSLSSLEDCRRDVAGRKGVKGLLLVGHEKVPCGFRLRTGDPSNTPNHTGNRGRPSSPEQITGKKRGLPEPQASISFLRYGTPNWAKQGRRTVCVCGCFKGL